MGVFEFEKFAAGTKYVVDAFSTHPPNHSLT